MFRFIFRNWMRHKERFILLIIGAIIIGTGLSYMIGLSQSNKGTVINNLEKRWKAPYHIVVRPNGTKSVTESERLLEPNYLSQIPGGITLEQYETIKTIEDTEITAPIAMIGYLGYSVTMDHFSLDEPGIYRLETTDKENNGITTTVRNRSHYFAKGLWSPSSVAESRQTGLIYVGQELEVYNNLLVAGIDPVQEAKLIGLNQAMVTDGESDYLEKDDIVTKTTDVGKRHHNYRYQIPIIMSKQSFVDKTTIYKLHKLNFPFSTEEEITNTIQKIKQNGGEQYLGNSGGTLLKTFSFHSKETHEALLKSLSGVDLLTGKKSEEIKQVDTVSMLFQRPSAINYQPSPSPYPKQWRFAYDIIPYHAKSENVSRQYGYRYPNPFTNKSNPNHIITLNWKGFYDPTKLDLPKDPLTELPMQTYRPPTASLVLDANNKPVNPPKTITATSNPLGFLAQPPMMLTTLKAAETIIGNKPISAIRIKVDGVEDLTKASQAKLERVARQIEKETGLTADITLGSSVQPAIVHVPKAGPQPEIGWIQQPWVRLGTSFTIFTQTQLGFTGVILAVMLVAVVYVFATNLVSLLARRKQFAVLLAVGWRPDNLMKLIFLESMILGLFVAVLSWGIESWIYSNNQETVSLFQVFLVGFLGLIIYFLGAIGPALLIRKITPYETMRTGEILVTSKKVMRARSPLSMALSSMVGKMKRNVLSITAIAVPTMLLTLFLFITFQLRGTLYTTWLGEYIALQVGKAHYIAMGAALAIAILITAEIMWQNVAERKPELAVLKAIGWRNAAVGKLILYEGLISGILAGIIGVLLSLGLILIIYQALPMQGLWFILLTGFIPVIVSLLASIPPATTAMRVSPSRGMRGPQE